jgi:hypothetical protein
LSTDYTDLHGLLNRKDATPVGGQAKAPQSRQGFLLFLKILFNLYDPCAEKKIFLNN